MAYAILEGRLQRQDVKGGRWEIVDRAEERRAMEMLSRLMAAEVEGKDARAA